MSWNNRVVWTEGMFLRTQHFQQSDRYHEQVTLGSLKAVIPHFSGIEHLELNTHLLNEGRIGLNRVRGLFPDGTLFDAPENDDAPEPLLVPSEMRDAVIHLCTPIRREGAVDVAVDDDRTLRRYGSVEVNVADITAEGAALAPVSVAKLNLVLLSDGQDLSGFESIPICRVIERRSDDSVHLDESFIPTAITSTAAPGLTAMISEIRGLLHQRAQAIAARLGSASAGGVAEITDFLLLQTVNRNEVLFRHLASLPRLHPERLYAEMAALAGELATFTESSNRPPEYPAYRHNDLASSFAPPLDSIRRSLSAVFEQSAIAIPLEQRGYGIHVGTIADKTLFQDATFVLAGKASVDTEAIRTNLPKRTTIGAVERIRDLVNLQLGGRNN